MVKVRVPATTANLGPGFDCLGMAVDVFNTVEIAQVDDQPMHIELFGSAASNDIAIDETNLVYRAAARVFELAGKTTAGIQLRLGLEAPLARGLGSSASAIVGGMFAANELLGRPLSTAELAWEITVMEGHPDNVIPCLIGGLTASLCLHDKVLYEKFTPASSLRCVFFIPDYELETSKARGVMPAQVSMKDAIFNGSRLPFVLSRLQSGNLTDMAAVMDDRLHHPYRIPLIKGYEDVRAACMQAGAAAVCISGAGPTILALCNDDSIAGDVEKAGRAVLEKLVVNPDCRIVQPNLTGCVVES